MTSFNCSLFLLFQGVRDQLYLSPPLIEKHTESLMAYFGALGFTKPVEQLVLWTMPLPSILYWLAKPRGPNLVESTIPADSTDTALSYRALAIAVTREMLYGEDGPLVGVGLVYKPSYIPTIPFSATYMRLNEWHSTASDKESESHLEEPCLLFIAVFKASGFFPVATQHPILLDTMSKEVVIDTEESVSPLCLRGFKLHSLFT